jgi:hypothetical protein
MTVIAGCSLIDGVMLLADCRVTVPYKSKTFHIDNLQKIIKLGDHSVIGFSGNVIAAGEMLKGAIAEIARIWNFGEVHPARLQRWLPRYFRFICAEITAKLQYVPDVHFMVASVALDRPNLIERARVLELIHRITTNPSSIQRNWIPNIAMAIVRDPDPGPYTEISDLPEGILYSMRSPDFIPNATKPLGFRAIGSGNAIVQEIERLADWVFLGDVGNSFVESMSLRRGVAGFVKEQGIESVGGMYPCVKVTKSGAEYCGMRIQSPVDGTDLSIRADADGRWMQQNHATGRIVQMAFPWEIDYRAVVGDDKFNDFSDLLPRRSRR